MPELFEKSPSLAAVRLAIRVGGRDRNRKSSVNAECSHGTPYSFFYKRGSGADVDKLLVYYQGGGACWDSVTCGAPVYDPDVTASDNPANVMTGFADLSNPSNPFRNWSSVFIAYCSAGEWTRGEAVRRDGPMPRGRSSSHPWRHRRSPRLPTKFPQHS